MIPPYCSGAFLGCDSLAASVDRMTGRHASPSKARSQSPCRPVAVSWQLGRSKRPGCYSRILKDVFCLPFVPGHSAVHLLDCAIHTTKLITDFDNAESYHSRVQAEEPPHVLLGFHRGVELHHEVVALSMLGLMLRGRARKVKLAPVLHAADDTMGGKDLLTGDSCDS
jgi:hypothetical protein